MRSRQRRLLLLSLCLPGVTWFLHLGASYGISSLACAASHRLQLHGLSIVALSAAFFGLFCSWKCWQQCTLDEPGLDHTSRRFLSIGALLLSLFFLLAIIAAGLQNFFIEECFV